MPTPQPRFRAGRLTGLAAAAGTALTLWAGAALAADPVEGEHAGGLPQLDPSTFPPQLVWLAISFAALYLLMSKVALPKVGEIVEQRQDRITSDLEKAQSMRDEAGSVISSYEKAIADARAQAQAAMAKASTEISQSQSARQSAFAADAAVKAKAAEERIAAARDQAVTNVRSVAVEVVQAAAERVAGVRVDASEADAAVGASMVGRA
ncbi:F0F1 ATP synthase subunit B family protein [Arenibaculum pallidiluteum]|uniref:F0F1 ATP synthase subunit B family protein n=1 Tax=Arenibaculum pallidiluteum TaxID=2812559 RepID=UPI001A970EFC|nr:ATPase [Arenibaculum pallidiluteum]